MAKMVSSLVPDMYEVGSDSATNFSFTPQIVQATQIAPRAVGSDLGVPPPVDIAGQTSNSAGGNAAAYAAQTTMRSPANHPIFWLVVLMAIGVVGLGFIAHMEVKRR